MNTAYELTQDSLTLTDNHPNVQKRGGKAGREDEYSYNFGTSFLRRCVGCSADRCQMPCCNSHLVRRTCMGRGSRHSSTRP